MRAIVKLLLVMLASAGAALVVSTIVSTLVGDEQALLVFGNAAFVGCAAFLVAILPDLDINRKTIPLTVLLYVVGSVGSAITAMMVVPYSTTLGMIFSAPMTAVGYYPSGPDMPFMYGATLWVLATSTIILSALLIGSALRRLIFRNEPE